jgi:SAM-dependent methyltransferase
MSGFSADWLALREPADTAARSPNLTEFVAEALGSRGALRILDLGTGSGSNVRYLTPRLRQPLQWRIVDNDPQLLAHARCAARDVQVIASDLDLLEPAWFEHTDLVTASALLDLVSEGWLARLVERCRAGVSAVLAVLNYDGRIICAPDDEQDAWICTLVNRHQRTDKGLGPALGPDAGRTLEAMLSDVGWEVRRAASDWVLGAGQAELQRQLIGGWALAALEIAPDQTARIAAWKQRRLAHVDHGDSQIIVGHDDVAGVLR